MALILIEGFDHYNLDDALEKGWGNLRRHQQSVAGRHKFPPSQAVGILINNSIAKNLPGTYNELIAGFAFNIQQMPTAHDQRFAHFGTAMGFGITTTGFACILDASGATIATGTTQLLDDTWYYGEFHVSSTSAEFHLDGVSEIAPTPGTYGSAWTALEFEFQVLGAVVIWVDDVYVIDPTTGVNTTFLGDVIVRTLWPGHQGTYADFSPIPSGLHPGNFDYVNERFIDGDASLVQDPTPGEKDSYQIQLFGGDTIFGAQLNVGARAGDFSSRQIEPLIRQAGTDYLGATETLTLAYLFYSWLLDQDPTGSDWTVATVDADEFGQELIT